jgi:hypothetical protein
MKKKQDDIASMLDISEAMRTFRRPTVKPSFELHVQKVKKFERTSYFLNCTLKDGSVTSHPISKAVADLLIGYGFNHST